MSYAVYYSGDQKPWMFLCETCGITEEIAENIFCDELPDYITEESMERAAKRMLRRARVLN